MSLPFGSGVTQKPEVGHADGAPTKPHLRLKIVITSIISVILTYITVYLIEHGLMAKFVGSYLKMLDF